MCVAVRLATGWVTTAVAGVKQRERWKKRQKEREIVRQRGGERGREREGGRESLTNQEQQKDRVHKGESV